MIAVELPEIVTALSAAVDPMLTRELTDTTHGEVPWMTVELPEIVTALSAAVDPMLCRTVASSLTFRKLELSTEKPAFFTNAVEFGDTTQGFVPWMTVEFPEICTGRSAALDGPPAIRTIRPNSVETGGAATTRAIALLVCGSPSTMISDTSEVDPRLIETVAARNVTVDGSCPATLL